MKNLMKITSSLALIILVSGCSYKGDLLDPKKPKIDDTLEVVDSNSIRTIADINAIAFEWRKVDDSRVVGYHFYRANLEKDGTKLQLIDTIKNKYATHYVDTEVEPNTKYVYKISSATKSDIESRTTSDYVVSTLDVPEGVSFIQAISNLPRQIKIVWRPHTNERIAYYKIEKSSPQTPKWEKLAEVEGRLQAEYIDEDLKDNVVYNYRVIAYTFDDIATKPSEIVKAQTKALPNGTTQLNATNDKPRKIILNWQPSESSDVLKYNIYRSSSATGGFSLVKTVNAQTLNFEDFVNEDGKIYFYKVTTTDVDNLESSKEINAVMGSTLAKVNKPIITLAQIQGERAILNWQSADKRTVSYNVYKTIKDGFFDKKTIKITGIDALRYEDKDIVRGVEYSYSIQAVDEFGIASEKTAPTELVLPKLKELN
ncbi:fibronectin type III domain-containing protein [Malaciobacter mytili]|uniref:fibronectin type III domain-containing protein n=1 Tax=Malaciobacter mytili TaxID=603050 RepID=UPI003A87109A